MRDHMGNVTCGSCLQTDHEMSGMQPATIIVHKYHGGVKITV